MEQPNSAPAVPWIIRPSTPPVIVHGTGGIRYALLRVVIGGMHIDLRAPVIEEPKPTPQTEGSQIPSES